jgi:hypothetical protein
MHCNKPWNREFIDANFSKSFLNGSLKLKREDVLLGIEEALLPETQELAVATRELQERVAVRAELKAALKLALDGYNAEENRLRAQIAVENAAILRLKARLHGVEIADAVAHGRDVQFIKHCPANACNGFLTAQYNCGLCKIKVCSKCLAPKGDNPAEHTCDPDAVASVEFLMRDTRPCPTCAAPIHKIDGCDQMWCTRCQTAFSWRTGRVETGTVHNPHWYEYQRRINNGQAAREAVPVDDPCAEGQGEQMPAYWVLPRARLSDRLISIHRKVGHIEYMRLPLYRGTFDPRENLDMRIAFLLGSIDKDSWKKRLQRREKERAKDLAIRHALEVVTRGSADIFHRLIRDAAFVVEAAEVELEALRKYANECLAQVCKRFGCIKIHMNDEWSMIQSRM